MDRNIIGLIVCIVYITVILFTSKFFEKKGKEASRKYIHIMLSNIWFFIVIFFDNYIMASILPALFVVINYLSYKFNIIKTMERDNKEEETLGTVYYAIVLLILAFWTVKIGRPLIGLPGVLIMGYGDGFAAIIGRCLDSKEYKVFGAKKTIAGTATMFIISFIIATVIYGTIGMNGFIVKGIIVAAVATIFEAASPKGLDNFSVPLIVSIITAQIM